MGIYRLDCQFPQVGAMTPGQIEGNKAAELRQLPCQCRVVGRDGNAGVGFVDRSIRAVGEKIIEKVAQIPPGGPLGVTRLVGHCRYGADTVH